MSDLDGDVRKLVKEIEDLKKRIAILELLVGNQKPETKKPNIWPNVWPDIPKFPLTTNCPKCGLDISKPMGYVCGNHDCPVGLGPTICGG